MNFLRKTLLTNNSSAMDVELEDLESGSRAANSLSNQPSTASGMTINAMQRIPSLVGTEVIKRPLDPSALSITHFQTQSPFSFCGLPQTAWPNSSGPSSDTPPFHFSAPNTTTSTTNLQASRKRAHQIEEHNNRVRIIELGPTTESTKVIMMRVFKVLNFY
jgi:hypothetical protein